MGSVYQTQIIMLVRLGKALIQRFLPLAEEGLEIQIEEKTICFMTKLSHIAFAGFS